MKNFFVRSRDREMIIPAGKTRDMKKEGKCERSTGEVVQKKDKGGERNGEGYMGDKDGIMEREQIEGSIGEQEGGKRRKETKKAVP